MKKFIALATAYWIAFFCALAYVESARAAEAPVAFKITRVADGDTFFGCLIEENVSLSPVPCFAVRVNNLNTPEKRLCHSKEMAAANACERCTAGSTLGLRAKMHAEKILKDDPVVLLTIITRDRYNRVVGDIRLPDGTDYAATMIALEFGAPYPCKNGKCGPRPRPWCPAY